MRSGSHLTTSLSGADRGLGVDRVQNVIQAVSPKPHFYKDLECAMARSLDVVGARKSQCSITDLMNREGIGAEGSKK